MRSEARVLRSKGVKEIALTPTGSQYFLNPLKRRDARSEASGKGVKEDELHKEYDGLVGEFTYDVEVFGIIGANNKTSEVMKAVKDYMFEGKYPRLIDYLIKESKSEHSCWREVTDLDRKYGDVPDGVKKVYSRRGKLLDEFFSKFFNSESSLELKYLHFPIGISVLIFIILTLVSFFTLYPRNSHILLICLFNP